MPVIILPMHRDDIDAVAELHSQQFPRQHNSTQWVKCNFSAFPRIMMFVARNEKDSVIGYIQWIHKSGFRKESIMELEQISINQDWQGQAIGTQLIKQSLNSIKFYLADTNSTLKAVMVTTSADNIKAQNLYKKALVAQTIAVISGVYHKDEVIMASQEL